MTGSYAGAVSSSQDYNYPGEVVQARLAGGEPEHGASAISYGHTPHPDDHMPTQRPRSVTIQRPKPVVTAEPAPTAPVVPKAKVEVMHREERMPVDYMACPRCGATFPIFTTQRPLKIECPSCGIKGVIK